MADNFDATEGSGATFAADDVGGVKYPRSKLIHGADGVNDGDVSTANPLPVDVREIGGASVATGGGVESGALRVTVASDSTGVLSVDDNGGAITVDWAGTAPPIGAGVEATALRVTVATDSTGVLSVDDNGGSLTVDGTVAATQSGTWNITNVSGTISLPTGAATAAKQPALGTAGTASADVISVQGIASMTPVQVSQATASNLNATVVGTGTFAVQVDGSALTALQLIDDAIHTDDAAFTLGTSKGVMMMGFAGTQSVNANDAAALACETDGALHIHDGGNTITVDGTVAATQSGTWTVDLGATDNAVLDTIASNTGTLASADLMLGTDFSAVFGVNSLLTTTQADNVANTIDTFNTSAFGYVFDGTTWDRMRGDSTDGLLVNLGTNNDVTITSGTVTTVTTVTTVSTVTAVSDAQVQGKAAADAAVSGNPVYVGARASTATPTAMSADGDAVGVWATREGALVTVGAIVDDAAFTVGTSRVQPVGFMADEASTDSVDEGDCGIARMTLDRKQIVTDLPHTAGGLTMHKTVSAASTNATSVKASAGQLYEIYCSNVNAAVRYLKLYNKASAPTVGTDTPVWTLAIPGNTAGAGFAKSIPKGLEFTTGIAFALTTEATDAGTTGVAASELVVNLGYK